MSLGVLKDASCQIKRREIISPPDLPFQIFRNVWKFSKRYFDVFGLFSKLIAFPLSAVACT